MLMQIMLEEMSQEDKSQASEQTLPKFGQQEKWEHSWPLSVLLNPQHSHRNMASWLCVWSSTKSKCDLVKIKEATILHWWMWGYRHHANLVAVGMSSLVKSLDNFSKILVRICQKFGGSLGESLQKYPFVNHVALSKSRPCCCFERSRRPTWATDHPGRRMWWCTCLAFQSLTPDLAVKELGLRWLTPSRGQDICEVLAAGVCVTVC